MDFWGGRFNELRPGPKSWRPSLYIIYVDCIYIYIRFCVYSLKPLCRLFFGHRAFGSESPFAYHRTEASSDGSMNIYVTITLFINRYIILNPYVSSLIVPCKGCLKLTMDTMLWASILVLDFPLESVWVFDVFNDVIPASIIDDFAYICFCFTKAVQSCIC